MSDARRHALMCCFPTAVHAWRAPDDGTADPQPLRRSVERALYLERELLVAPISSTGSGGRRRPPGPGHLAGRR
ncbi:hypothetical protein [Streptomyces pinistramenti]|uniref:hypothetical protein n=1 Tax=Streptomyces pinistramenti TaxID=2884812 RepID=UPI001D087D71|nr:hypothetical protein [Streptomyces pinistramenti]MCB5907705.1 hypothetical protein [Streptomyces pinistramenti]